MAERFTDRLRRIVLRASAAGSDRPPAPPAARRGTTPSAGHPPERDRPRPGAGVPPPAGMRTYPGDFPGVPAMRYAPQPDGLPDPGEIVWTWIPFEEDSSVGKDRPVLLVGNDGDWLLGVMLTSRDHDRSEKDRAHERAEGRDWLDVGSGAWDSKGRPSEVRTDRILRVDPDTVRREGAVLGREVFEAVAQRIRATS